MRYYSIMLITVICVFLSACAPAQRFGMVENPESGLQYGSIVERNLFVDAAQLENKKLKVTIRNVSGDEAFDLKNFRETLESAYASKGYEPTVGLDFGLRLDINVLYSGKIRSDMRNEFAFLGASAGGIIGYRSDSQAGTAIGILSGMTLGAILGSYVTDDTYIVVTEVNLGIIDSERGLEKNTIIFSSSECEDNQKRSGMRPFNQRLSTRLAAYAGGRNVRQAQIAEGVRQRLIRILADII